MKTNHAFAHAVIITFGALIGNHAEPRYEVVNLGSLGGSGYAETFSGVSGKLLSNRGGVAAGMETAKIDPVCSGGECRAWHGFLWEDGTLFDLGLLGTGDRSDFSQ